MARRPSNPEPHEVTPLRLGRVAVKPSASRQPTQARLALRLRRWLGLPKTLTIGGVRYRERSNLPVHRALGPGGPGVKEYDARFLRTGRTMRLRMTQQRQFADLGPSVRSSSYTRLSSMVRPGDRLLEFGCGTGDGTHILAELAGPSGSVIALTNDREAVRFARERYPNDTVGFELGGVEAVRGELDGAFDRIFWPMPQDLEAAVELTRILRPGGLLIVVTARGDSTTLDSKTWPFRVRDHFHTEEMRTVGGAAALILSRSESPPPPSGRRG